MGIKLSTDSLMVMAAFERVTKVHAKDCLVTDTCVYFLVESGKIGLAIGKSGSVVKDVSRVLGRPVRVYGYSKDITEMVRGMIPQAKSVEVNGDTVTVAVQPSEKTAIIGKAGGNIKAMRDLMERHFNTKHLRLK